MKKENLSNELRVIIKIYEYNKVIKKPVNFTILVDCFKGKISRGGIARNLEKLLDFGMLSGDWEKYPDDKWHQTFTVSSISREFVRNMYMGLEGLENKKCPTCGQMIE